MMKPPPTPKIPESTPTPNPVRQKRLLFLLRISKSRDSLKNPTPTSFSLRVLNRALKGACFRCKGVLFPVSEEAIGTTFIRKVGRDVSARFKKFPHSADEVRVKVD